MKNRTLIQGDNLEALRRLPTESIDLAYLDPPYNSNRDYGEFDDRWQMDKEKENQIVELSDEHPDLAEYLLLADKLHSKSMKAYLVFMTMRLIATGRALKETSSLYLQCDDAASHYLKVALDCIFGAKAFRNEVVWWRHNSNNAVTSSYGRITDTLLFYAMSKKATWNQQYHEYEKQWKERFRHRDEKGVYALNELTSPETNENKRFTWRGATPKAPRGWSFSKEKLEEMLANGEIQLKKDGTASLAGRKRYYKGAKGKKLQNLWMDVGRLGNIAKERVDYPTQKPLVLLERIIKVSSNKGDMVLDPFCGSGTTLVAAEKLGRKWIGMDASANAIKVAVKRLKREARVIDGDKKAKGLPGWEKGELRVVDISAKPELNRKSKGKPAR